MRRRCASRCRGVRFQGAWEKDKEIRIEDEGGTPLGISLAEVWGVYGGWERVGLQDASRHRHEGRCRDLLFSKCFRVQTLQLIQHKLPVLPDQLVVEVNLAAAVIRALYQDD